MKYAFAATALALLALVGPASAEESTVPHDASLATVLSATSWLNGTPTAAGLRGKVVIVDVFTYDCFNCQNITPNLRSLAGARHDGLVILGIHSPETAVEHDREQVVRHLRSLGVTWPVAIDNDFALWNAYRIQYWPTQLIFDRRGTLRRAIVGDSQDAAVDATVNALLREPASEAGPSTHLPGDDAVRARLILGTKAVTPGTSLAMTIELTPARGWHLYGPDHGDAGLPPGIAWTLPRGTHAGAIVFPHARRVERRGSTTYEYRGRTDLRVPLMVATTAKPSNAAMIRADVSWLACSNVCAPGRASLIATVAIRNAR